MISSVVLADGLSPDPLPFDEAVKFMKARLPLTKAEWSDLEPKLRFRAFTVARLAQIDTIEAVRKRLISALEKGGTLEGFWKDKEFRKISGIHDSKPDYWETVFRTNIQTAYNAGRAMQVMRDNPPYLEFVGIEDARQTKTICRPRSGVVLPSSHSWWKTNWPPLHFKCRSTIREVWHGEIRDGIRVTTDKGIKTISREHTVARGFGGNPIDTGSFWKLTPSMLSRAKEYGIVSEIESLAKELGIDSYVLKATPARKVRKQSPKPKKKTREEQQLFSGIGAPELKALAEREYRQSNRLVRRLIEDTHAGVAYAYDNKGDTTYYHPGENLIVIARRHMKQPGTFLHEYGHYVDYKVFEVVHETRDTVFRRSYEADKLGILGSGKAAAKKRERLSRLFGNDKWRNDPNVSDLFGAVTDNTIKGRFYHPDDYYQKRTDRKERETFANLFEIYSRKDRAAWKLVKKELPELARTFEQYVEK